MNIVEPQGISLIDKILASAKELNIQCPRACPLFLELTFKGYTTNGTPTEITIGKRYWKIMLADIKTNLDAGGSQYTIEAPVMGDYAFSKNSNAAVIKQQIDIPITNVGDFFDRLGETLTKQSRDAASPGKQVADIYTFKVDPSMRSWVISAPPDNPNTPSLHLKDGVATATFNTDSQIDNIVDVILSATKEGSIMINPNSNPEKSDQNPIAPNVVKIAKVTGKVKFNK